MHCLSCGRELGPVEGEVEVGGHLMCKGCAHIMTWAADMTLRELTAAERIEAGANQALMLARLKIVPDRSIKHRGTSLVTTGLMLAIVIMVALERTGVMPPIHQRGGPVWHKRPAWPAGHDRRETPRPWPSGGRP